MSIITTIIDGLKPNPSSGLGGANEGYIQGFQDDIISGVAGGVADKAGGQCLVTQNSPLGMSVLVTNGVVYVPNSDYVAGLASTTKYYRVVIKDHDPIVIPANTSGDERFDGIDIVLDKDVVPNEYASNVATIVVSAGNSTEPPAVPDNGYRLAEVEVADGATQIVTAAINDVRAQITINDDALPSTTVYTTATQTLTNKTLTSPVINTGVSGTAIPTLVDGTKVYAADVGSTDDYAITLAPAPTAYATGQTFRFKANTANTGPATLNVNALGAKTIKKNYNSDLATGDILANQLVEVIYDGTNFQLLSPSYLTNLGSEVNSIFRQAIIDGGCQVAQGTAANLSTSKAYGQVDLIYGIAEGTVGAGTITQTTSPNCGFIGTAFKLSGVTLTGSGKVKAGYRMEAKDAKKYKNQIASFSVKVYHDVGSAKNYKVYINKANSSDNFSAVTNISTSSNQLVNNATDTTVTFENISLGDCTNGLEIIVESDCGAITTKNFEFTEFQFNKGAVVLPFVCLDFAQEIARTMRYYEKSYTYTTPPLTALSSQGVICLKVSNNTIATAEKYGVVKYLIKKRNVVTPSIHPWTTPTNTGRVSASTGGGDLAANSGGVDYENENSFVVSNKTGGTLTTDGQAVIFHFVADARL